MTQRLFLRKTEKEKMELNPKLPYFRLVLIPEGEDDGDWQEVAAFWKAKSGNGYSGKTADGVEISMGAKKKPDFSRNRSTRQDEDMDAAMEDAMARDDD